MILLWVVEGKTFVGEYDGVTMDFPPTGDHADDGGFYFIGNIYEMNKMYIPSSGFKIIATFCGNAYVKFDKMLMFLLKDSEYYIEYIKREEQREKDEGEFKDE